MKKIYLTIALLFGMMTVSFGQSFGSTDGFFMTNESNDRQNGSMGAGDIQLPSGFSVYNNDAGAPLGTGLLILTALGAGYTLRKKLQK